MSNYTDNPSSNPERGESNGERLSQASTETHQVWAPPTQQHVTGDPWTNRTESSSSSKGQMGGLRWLAVVAVSALIGAGVGASAAVVADDDSNDSLSLREPTSTPQVISTPATPSNIRSVLDKVQPAVVSVEVGGRTSAGNGTGMILSSDGYILTNAHVVSGASAIRVGLVDQKESVPAQLRGVDPSIDAAIIKIDGDDLPTVELGDSNAIQVGDEVVAIGNALALAGGPSVTTGIVSAKDRDISDGTQLLENLLQTDAAINPGNSGGPLVNMAGQVVGMNTAVIRGQEGEFQNIGFAMSINAVKPVLDDLRSGKVRQQALLGVSAVTLTDDIRDRYNLSPEKGAVVDSVVRSGPADEAGLSRFDVITELDGKEIATSEDLTSQVRAHEPNDKVMVVYYRGDERIEVEVTLDARPIGR